MDLIHYPSRLGSPRNERLIRSNRPLAEKGCKHFCAHIMRTPCFPAG